MTSKAGTLWGSDMPRWIITESRDRVRRRILRCILSIARTDGGHYKQPVSSHCKEKISWITRFFRQNPRRTCPNVLIFYDDVKNRHRKPHRALFRWRHDRCRTGGTSDILVAEEVRLTAEVLGNHVIRLYDVGVAGPHRLLSNMELFIKGNAIIAVAGMEGALASASSAAWPTILSSASWRALVTAQVLVVSQHFYRCQFLRQR